MSKNYDIKGLNQEVQLGRRGNKLVSDTASGVSIASPNGSQGRFLTNTPISGLDAANKDYVDSSIIKAGGGDYWQGVVTVSTAHVPIGGAGSTLLVNGVLVSTGDRVLLTAQSDPIENGIYVYDGVNTLSRAQDADEDEDFIKYKTVYVSEGNRAGDTWSYDGESLPIVGTNPLIFGFKAGGETPLDSIETDNIKDQAVTREKIADGAINNSKLDPVLSGTIESTIKRIKNVITYTDTSPFLIGSIPTDAIVMRVFVKVTQIFDQGSTLSVGDAAPEKHLTEDDVDLTEINVYTNDDVNMNISQDVFAYLSAGLSTGGQAEIYVEYLE